MNENQTHLKKEKLRKKHIVAEVIICLLAALGVMTILAPFILIPIAFAFPIIIGKPKLLFIPVCVVGAIFLVLLFVEATVIPILLFIFAIISTFGAGAGLLIRRFRESRKRIKILVNIISVIILIAPFLFVLDLFSGLVRYPFVALRIHTYVARNYSDFDLTVSRLSFDFKSNNFNAQVRDSNNPDISFRINNRGGTIYDGFTSGSFWEGTLNHMLGPLLEQEFGAELQHFSSNISGVQIGQRFDLAANVEKTARITIAIDNATDNITPENLTSQISRYHDFISRNGFSFTEYIFSFTNPELERSIEITVSPAHINDSLPAMIEYARKNRNQSGVFQRPDFRYISRVDFTRAVD